MTRRSASVDLDYNGHHIGYDEDDDVWHCRRLELESSTLRALKTKIREEDKHVRKVDKVKAIYISHWNSERKPAVITLIVSNDECWVTTPTNRRGGTAESREKVKFSGLVLDTPENRAILEEADRKSAEASAMQETASDMMKAIPRISKAMLMEMKVAAAEEEA